MDEEIEASPTSQRKRKKPSKCRASKKMSTTGADNVKSEDSDQNIKDTIEDSGCSFRHSMWQSAYLLEENDRLQIVPKNGRSHRSLQNEFRMSGPADFVSVSQLCATRATNRNEDEESQWDVTESQFRQVDDEIKEFQVSEMESGAATSVQVKENVTARSDERIDNVPHNEESAGSANSTHNSSQCRSSVRESILSEWASSSPVKMYQTQSEVLQFSPKFKFNRKRSKKFYKRTTQNSDKRRKLVNDVAAPATSSACHEIAVETIRPNGPANASNDDDEDFDESMNIVDNIHNLSKFFSQSSGSVLVENNGDATESTASDSRNIDLAASKTSFDDEEDFLGFDGKDLTGGLVSITLPEFFLKCDRKFSALTSITLPEIFHEFDSDSDSNDTLPDRSTDTNEHLLLMEDDDIFANFSTQQYIPKHEMWFEKPTATTSAVASTSNDDLAHRTRGSETNSGAISTETAIKTFGQRANIFEDIDREFDVASNLLTSSFTESAASTISLGSSTRPQCLPNTLFPGFSTVTGKQIPVSSASISNKMSIFQSVTVSEEELKKVDNWISDNNHRIGEEKSSAGIQHVNSNVNPVFTGFSTARGNNIPVSSNQISKTVNLFDCVKVTEDELEKMNSWIEDERQNDGTRFELGANPLSMCFTTAQGKRIAVSPTKISKMANSFQNVSVIGEELTRMGAWIGDNDLIRESSDVDFSLRSKQSNLDTNPSPTFRGLATARAKMNDWIDDERRDDEANDSLGINRNHFDPNPNPTLMGFTTAGGKHMPSAHVAKRIAIFDDVDVTADELQKMNHYFDDVGHSNNTTQNASSTDRARKMPISRSLFSNAAYNVGDNQTKQRNSTELFREVTNTPQRDADNVPKKLPVDTFIKPSPMRKMSMINSLRQLETLKENVDAKPILSVDENDSVHRMSNTTTTCSEPFVCVTPTNNQKTYSQIGRESVAALLEDDELIFANKDVQLKEHTPGFASGFMVELTASSTPINKVDRNKLKQRRLAEKFDDIALEDYVESNIVPGTAKIQVPSHVKSLRTLAIEEQQRSITKKTNVKAVPSSLYVNKLTSTKLKWKEFVEHSRPINKPMMGTDLTSNVLNVTASNATKFKFNAWDHYSDEFCRENTNGIHLQDDIVVMMDENCQVGLTEISSGFLSCPSVDPKLVHDKWIENNMKWIVLKLAAMERSFPHRFAGKVVTLENLMLQMKYRYEREIDRAERSSIRKICEMDDVPEKRMILFVAGITRSSTECELELSDGWYSLTSTLDYGMRTLVNEGKIKVGTKLVIQGANTINLSDGCHPLDVPANVKLKIHANSTRRARWDSKLGYCKNPGPFEISLRSVWGNGGNIAKLRICVLRVYPVVYIDPKNLKDVHSEKVERRRNKNEECERSSIVERVFNDVSRDIEEEEMNARCENRPRKIVKLAEISAITDPAYLCELLDNDKDPERIEAELTNTQKTMVFSYKDKLNCQRSEEINTRVKERLAAIDKGQRKVVPFLRFKITDEMLFDKTAMVTVWKPTEEILSLIKEESVFDLTGSSSRGVTLSELQIYAGKNATFRKANVVTRVPKSLLRRHTSISEILSIEHLVLNELDTTGFVIHVGESLHSIQPVYIADSDHNILCINFWQSIKDFAYEDVVQPKRFLAIRNLQWRKNSNSKPIPCAHVTEYSVFTENPQSTELSSAITTLKEKFANIDVNEFIETCMEKVRSFNSACQQTPTQSSLSSSSLQTSASSLPKTPTEFSQRSSRSSLSNQSRIDLLSKYGDGMPTPPLKISSLNKSFKLPVNT